jgi:hypothetical protein
MAFETDAAVKTGFWRLNSASATHRNDRSIAEVSAKGEKAVDSGAAFT